jgi:Flp pilus assembly protein TadG
MRFMQGWNRFRGSKRAAGPNRSRGDRVRAWLCGGEDGQALVEAALSITAFMMILMGIVALGTIYNNQIMLTQAVGSGAQYLQSLNSAPAGTDPCALTYAYIRAAAPNLTGTMTVKFTLGSAVVTTNSCSLSQIQPSTGSENIKVEAWYPCTFVVLDFNDVGCQVYATTSEVIVAND